MPGFMEEKRQRIVDLVEKLDKGSQEERKMAAIDLRLLAKWDTENRQYIAEANGVEFLVPLLDSRDGNLQENAITTLLNLSILPENRVRIMETHGALDGIMELLKFGLTSEVKENAAATLFSLLIVEEYREVVGQLPGSITSLLDLLKEASTHRGKKDAIKVLFHLALHPANKPRIVAAGAVPLLLSYLLQKRAGLTEDALSVLAALALCPEGVAAMMKVGILPTLVEILRTGSLRAKENVTAVLLVLCQRGGDVVFEKVSKYSHHIIATLCTLLTVGSDRGKQKAKALMGILVGTDSSCSSTSMSSFRSVSYQ